MNSSSRVESEPTEGGRVGGHAGEYQLVAKLGQGGLGTVYLALAGGLGQLRRLLVVKELRPDLTSNERFVSMFMDEAKLATRLDHPHVVQTFEAGRADACCFIAMEYLDGQPLSALIERFAKQGLPLWVHLQILCDALAGLHYAHRLRDSDGSLLSIVHRDVSPQNVFVTYDGQVKVVDFGVAKAVDATEAEAPGMFKGKFAYAAPEQIIDQSQDARTDVFAVGVMLWEAIARRRFSGPQGSPSDWRARAEGTEPRIRQVVPEVNPDLARMCDRALSVDPEQRYASADAFRADLQQYVQSCTVRVEPAEIGRILRETFDRERRAVHALIEQAMSAAGQSSATSASQLDESEAEVTAVADLSRLVDVSLERDDDKIRDSYAATEPSTPSSPSSPSRSVPLPRASGRTVRGRLIASAVVSGLCMVGVGLLLSSRYSASTAAPSPARAAVSVPASAPAEPVSTAAVELPAELPREVPVDVAARVPATRETPNRNHRRPIQPPVRVPRSQPPRASKVEAAVVQLRAPVANEPVRPEVFDELPASDAVDELRRTKRAADSIYIEDPY